MKKALIAGVASVALAAMPLVGVFATDITTMTDTLTITIDPTCTFDAASHAYTADMSANALNDSVGTTTMKVTCNVYNGYYVTAAFTSLAGNGSNAITYSNVDPTAGSGTWTAALSASNLSNGGRVMQNTVNTPAAGDSETITYKVSTTDNQAAGTYSGTATYTLTSPYANA